MPTSTAGKSNKHGGFTLLELMLVVLLMGLFASIGFPYLSNFEPDRLKGSGRRLALTIRYLYNEAIMTGQEQRLQFDLDHNRYRALTLGSNRELRTRQGLARERALPAGVYLRRIYQPGRGEQQRGQVTMALLPEGWLEETALYLQLENERKLTLHVLPMTGETEFFSGWRDFQ